MRRLFSRASALAIGLTIGSGALHADTITFKDGTPPLECRVLEEGPDSIVVEIKVTEAIKDRKTIARSVIREITKVPPDLADYETLRKKMVPTPDMLSVEDYGARIELLKGLLLKYPTSEYVPQVQKMVEMMESEKELVELGGVKLDGEWISPEDRRKRSYNVDADILFRKMKALAEARQNYTAIQTFDELERLYPASVVFPEAVLLARQIIPEIEKDLQKQIVRHPSLEAERAAGLRSLETNEQEHKRTKEAIEAERREFMQIVEREKLAKTKWITYYAYDLESLEDALEIARKEVTRILAYDVSSMRAAAGMTSKLMEFLHLKDLDKAEAFLKQAEASGGQKTALDKFRTEIARLRKEAKDGGATKPPSTPVTPPSTEPKAPAPDPVKDLQKDLETPASKRMRELEEEKQRNLEEERKKKEAAAAPTAEPTAGSPGPVAEVPKPVSPVAGVEGAAAVGEPGAAGGGSEPGTPEVKPDPTPVGGGAAEKKPSEPTAPAPKEEKPKEAPASGGKAATPAKAGGGMPLWNIILLGLAGVLVVVTVIAKMGQKKRGGGKGEGEGAAP